MQELSEVALTGTEGACVLLPGEGRELYGSEALVGLL